MRFAQITLTLLALACCARAGGPTAGIPGAAGIGGVGGRFGGAGDLGSYGGGYGPGAFGPAMGISGIGAVGGQLGGMGGVGSYGSGYGPGAFGGAGGFFPGAGVYGPPQPYNTQYQAPDGQGGGNFRTESSDGSGAVTGSYGYTDAQGLYRFVEYVADVNGFRAKVQTNEPGVDGKENPADVIMQVEKTPYGIQEQYTPVQAYGIGGAVFSGTGGYGGISGARPGAGGMYPGASGIGGYSGILGARPGVGGIYPASAGIGGFRTAGQGSPSAGFPLGLGAGRPATPFGVAGPAGTGVLSTGAGGIRPTFYAGAAGLYPLGVGGSGVLAPMGGVSSPFGSISRSTSNKSSY